MSALKAHLHDYATAVDTTWLYLEDAIQALKELNDTLYTPEGELKARSCRSDVTLLTNKVKELKAELAAFENAKEPLNLSPILPGEIRY